MIIAVVVEAVVFTIIICLLLRDESAHAKAGDAIASKLVESHREAEQAWEQERRELLTRIQRPEHVPAGPLVQFEIPDPEPDEIEMVGTIKYDDDEEG